MKLGELHGMMLSQLRVGMTGSELRKEVVRRSIRYVKKEWTIG
jgi:hypothetical protein